MENIKILPFNITLLSTLADMVRDAWHLEKSIKNKFLLKMACTVYSAHIISKSNYIHFLKSGSNIVSFLAARKENRHIYLRYFYLLICFIAVFFMLFFKDGRSILKYQLGYNKTLDLMRNENNQKYNAELVLFITHPEYQGKGYGKSLLNEFHNFMKEQHKFNIYLFTDNYCDYSMYDKAGCIRQNKKVREFYFLAGERFTQELYLYDYKIN